MKSCCAVSMSLFLVLFGAILLCQQPACSSEARVKGRDRNSVAKGELQFNQIAKESSSDQTVKARQVAELEFCGMRIAKSTSAIGFGKGSAENIEYLLESGVNVTDVAICETSSALEYSPLLHLDGLKGLFGQEGHPLI